MPSWNSREYAARLGYQGRGLAVQVVAWEGEMAVGRAMVVLPGHPEWSVSAFREGCPSSETSRSPQIGCGAGSAAE